MSSNVCKRLKVLEKGLGEPDDNDEGVKEVLELLWQYEKAIEHFRQCPNYAELDLELAQSTVHKN